MICSVEFVDDEKGILKEFWFTKHAVRLECAGKIVNNDSWCFFPPRIKSGKYVVASFGDRYTVKPIRHAMCTPWDHDAASKFSATIFCVVFPAPAFLFHAMVFLFIFLKEGISRPGSNLRAIIQAACL